MRKKKNYRKAEVAGGHDLPAGVERVKSEFIALASHQLRTPLSVVNWYTEMLLNGDAGKINTEQKSYLTEIYNSNQQLIALVNSLLNISRLEMGTLNVTPELTDIQKIIRDILGEHSSVVQKKHLKVVISIPPRWSKLMVDRKLIRIVLYNLMRNAVKYTPASGRIRLTVIKQKQNIIFKISDTGIGIPRNQQPQIFTKFFRAHNAREIDTDGSGLGLYTVRAIIKKIGGKVWFSSEQNNGSTFFVALPCQAEHKAV